MRSVIDWLSDFYGPKKNAFLRLSEADRIKLGVRTTIFFAVVAALFAMWHWVRS
jgi:hypothetical protein